MARSVLHEERVKVWYTAVSTTEHPSQCLFPRKNILKEPIQLNTELAQTPAATGSGMGWSHWERAVLHLCPLKDLEKKQ